MKTFYLVRHAEFDRSRGVFHGRLPVPLTDEGIAHAERVAAFFKDKNITTIYASEVARCRQTAEIIQKVTKSPLVFDKRLLEILTVIQGMPMDEYFKDRDIRYTQVDRFGGETMRDVQVRMLDFFYDKMKSESSNLIICSHSDGLDFLYLALAKQSLPASTKGLDRAFHITKGGIRPVTIDGASITLEELITV